MSNNKYKKKSNQPFLLLIIGFVCICFTALFYFSLKEPFFELMAKKEKLKNDKEISASKKNEENNLQNQINFLKTKKGMKYIARSSGFYEPDDILIIVTEKQISEEEMKKDK